jgi:hypothetical protein
LLQKRRSLCYFCANHRYCAVKECNNITYGAGKHCLECVNETEQLEDDEDEAEKTIISDKTLAKKAVGSKKPSQVRGRKSAFYRGGDDDEDEAEQLEDDEDEDEAEKTIISDKTLAKKAVSSTAVPRRSSALPKTGLLLEPMADSDSDDEDNGKGKGLLDVDNGDYEEQAQEDVDEAAAENHLPQPRVSAKRPRPVLTETQEEAVRAVASLPPPRKRRGPFN